MNKYFTIIAFCLLPIIVVACGSSTPSASALETAVAQTLVAMPTRTSIPTQTPLPTQTLTPTPTPIPLSDIALEPILLISGDLPTDFVGGQVKSIPPRKFEGVPTADQVIQQGFRAGDYASDGIMILLYKSPSDLDTAYNTLGAVLEKDVTLEPLSDVGEKAVSAERSILGVKSTQIVFTRCQALVYIDLFATSANTEVATTYAQRLDKRLRPFQELKIANSVVHLRHRIAYQEE